MVSPLWQLLDQAVQVLSTARRWAAFWAPVADVPPLVAPFVALGSLISLALMTGLAVSSLASFLVAVLALYLLVTEVLGISVDLDLA